MTYRVFVVDSDIYSSGGRGIRTPGGVTLNSFQDCRIRPLCHSSNKAANITTFFNSIKRKRYFILR